MPNTNELDISPEDLAQRFTFFAGHNEIENVKQYLNKFPHLIEANKYEAIRTAAENGAYDVLSYLFSQATSEQIEEALDSKDHYAFCIAAQQGFKKVVELLWNKTSNDQLREKMFSGKDYLPFSTAVRDGRLEVIKFLWSIANDEQKITLVNKFTKKNPSWTLHPINSLQTRKEIFEIMASDCPKEVISTVKSLAKYYFVTITEKTNLSSNSMFTTSTSNSPTLTPLNQNTTIQTPRPGGSTNND